MSKNIEDILSIFKDDERIYINNEYIIGKIQELALKYDEKLISTLLNNVEMKAHFFKEVGGALIFKREEFIEFIGGKYYLEDSYTKYRNKIGLAVKNNYIKENRDVVLNWAYKDCILEGGQDKEDVSRKEVFYNEILASNDVDKLFSEKVLTNFKFINKKYRKIDKKDNLIINGNNLIALHSLKSVYRNSIKMIYIDIPYNTGSDSFKYNDKFNNSTWLTFMKNRLDAAKELLSNNGMIFVQTSYHMYPYLKVLMDEVLQGGYICTLNIMVRHPERILKADKEYHDVIEYVLIYAKDKNLSKLSKRKVNNNIDEYVYSIKEKEKGRILKINDDIELTYYLPNEYEEIKLTKASNDALKKISIRGSLREGNSSGRFYVKHLEKYKGELPERTLFKVKNIGNDKYDFRYFYLPDKNKQNGGYYQGVPNDFEKYKYIPYPNFIDFVKEYNSVGYEGGIELRNAKKPEALIDYLIDIAGVNDKDIILDFFMGSGTTCAVAHKRNIQYIGIEQLDYDGNGYFERLNNVINGVDKKGITYKYNWENGGSFVYCELMKWNEIFINKINNVTNSKELADIWRAMKEKSFLSYRVKVNEIDKNMSEFEELSLEQQKQFLIEILDKNHLYVNLSEIDDTTYNVSDEDKKLNKEFYELK